MTIIWLAIIITVLCSADHIRSWLKLAWLNAWNAVRGKFGLVGQQVITTTTKE